MTKSIYFFIIVIFSLSLVGCDKENEDVQTPEPNKTKFELLLEEYNLLDSEVTFENYTLGIDTNLIYFNGRKKDQLFIECFSRTDKSNVLSWNKQAAIDTIVTVDKGYGETATYTFENFKLRQAYTYKNNHVFILQGGDENSFEILSCDLILVSDQNFSKKKDIVHSVTLKEESVYNIYPWIENYIIYQRIEESGAIENVCYSLNGGEIFKAQNYGHIKDKNFIPLNMHECISFDYNSFIRNDLTQRTTIWRSENVLPDNSRVDDAEITQEDPDYVIFDLKYTLYSGDKKSKKFKVNIESGTFTEV